MKTPTEIQARRTELKASLRKSKERYKDALNRQNFEEMDAIVCETGAIREKIELIDWILEDEK